MKFQLLSILAVTLAFVASSYSYDDKAAHKKDANNSVRNEAVHDNHELTAQDQGTSPADVALTQKIRQNVVAEKNLSTDATNIKIITINGKVTLKGPVDSNDEKRRLEAVARKVAGKANVTSQIEVSRKE